MRRIRLSFSILITLFVNIMAALMTAITANADMSPQPALSIRAGGFPENSYVAVVSEQTVPGYHLWHVDDTWFDENTDRWLLSKGPEEINRRFYEYAKNTLESEGWFLWGNIDTCESGLKFSHLRPSRFRILVYLAGDDRFVVTDQVFRCSNTDYHVNIYYESGQVIAGEPYSTVRFSRIIFRACLTIAIELTVCLFFLKKKNRKNIRIIAVANLVTQLILYIPLLSARTAEQYYPMLILLEIVITLGEGRIYAKRIKNEDMKHPYYYSLLANMISFAAGLFLPG